MKNIHTILNNLKKNHARIVGCFPLYPPIELIHSMGLVPIVLWGLKESIPRVDHSDQHLQAYACSVSRHLVEFILSQNNTTLDGLLMYNACDTLRNLPEIMQCGFSESERTIPILKLHIPMMPRSQSEVSSYLASRINNLIHDLECVFATSFSLESFRESVSKYGCMRDLCATLEEKVKNGLISYEKFSSTIQENYFIPVEDQIYNLQTLLNDCLSSSTELKGLSSKGRVIISGILPPPDAVIKIIEGNGLLVVGNDIASQRRSYFYTPAAVYDPVSYYTDFYNNHFPCPTLLYSADDRVNKLKDLIMSTEANGFIFVGEKFCEYEYFEMPYLEKVLQNMGVPTLFLEISIEDEEPATIFTRIEAFSEMINSRS
jgi:benzoyl-CoA reductase/2-hydroxyglutaryl-CoA dehydratase subunit BcrC/BadD/HgdB